MWVAQTSTSKTLWWAMELRHSLFHQSTLTHPPSFLQVEAPYLPLRFSIQQTIEIGDQIYVVSNDEQEEIVEVDVLASMSSPLLAVTPNPLNMGQTYVGCDMENVVILENKGTEELVIMDLAQLGEQFSLLEQPALPIVLQPGELFPLDLVYEPSAEANNQGALHIQSNDPRDAGIYVARQSGTEKLSTSLNKLGKTRLSQRQISSFPSIQVVP